MNGKVKGLPIKVPISEAIMLPLKIYAKITASKKWNPIKGENDTIEPQATPIANLSFESFTLINFKK